MLNKRLLAIAKYVPNQAKVLDVGCDHAHLAIYLMQNKQLCAVIASDIVDGPVDAARKNIRQSGLNHKIKLVQADGLAGVQPGEADCIIIAGMGASTIIDILMAGQKVLQECKTLILQPMVGADKLRIWLAENSWECFIEELCFDNGRLYEIMVARPIQNVYTINKLQALVGNLHKDDLFLEHIQTLIDKQQQLLDSLQLAVLTDAIAVKIRDCRTILEQLQEVKNENTRNL